MDRMIVQRLSDYFSVWRMKVMLGQSAVSKRLQSEQSSFNLGRSNPIEESKGEHKLTFSAFQRDLDKEQLNNPMRSHIRVQ